MNVTGTGTTGTVITTQPMSPLTPVTPVTPLTSPDGQVRRSRSKSKQKKRGFWCCRRKKKPIQKKKKKGKKAKGHRKVPRVVKPLAPVQNEQLGDIVLVKNVEKPPVEVKKVDSKVKVTETEKEIKKEEKEKKKKEEDPEIKDKWLKLAKRLVDEDAQMAQVDFEQVASYIPSHVTKHNFTQNMHENRFSDIICMDHSRVILKDFTYIHANWVDIEEKQNQNQNQNQKKKRAILTQMPLAETAANFWQMIIEQKVKGMVLVLTDEEYEELGGDFVFPQNQDFLHFPERCIRVGEFKRVEITAEWTMRVVSVFNGDYKSFLHIHHLKNWPHNGVPRGTDNVKQMWQVQSVLRKYSGPVVYMSLSGCGRAGTFALFEVAHATLHTDAPFDMVKCLERVRSGRLHAVQTIRQFSFVYTLLAEHILGNGFCKLVTKKDVENEENCIQQILRQLTIE